MNKKKKSKLRIFLKYAGYTLAAIGGVVIVSKLTESYIRNSKSLPPILPPPQLKKKISFPELRRVADTERAFPFRDNNLTQMYDKAGDGMYQVTGSTQTLRDINAEGIKNVEDITKWWKDVASGELWYESNIADGLVPEGFLENKTKGGKTPRKNIARYERGHSREWTDPGYDNTVYNPGGQKGEIIKRADCLVKSVDAGLLTFEEVGRGTYNISKCIANNKVEAPVTHSRRGGGGNKTKEG